MPAKSIAQQHLMQAAEHGAQFPMAQKLRQTMTMPQLHDFSVGPEAGKPQHVTPQAPAPPPAPGMPSPSMAGPTSEPPAQPPMTMSLLRGDAPSIVGSNTSGLRQSGLSELDATKRAIGLSGGFKKPSSRHSNLGKFLHPRKDGKAHGSGSE